MLCREISGNTNSFEFNLEQILKCKFIPAAGIKNDRGPLI